MKLNLFQNKNLSIISSCCTAQYYNFSPNFYDLLRQAITFSFDNVHAYNIVLWVMSYEFIGSYIVFALLALFSSSKNRLYVYCFAGFITFFSPYSSFILGLILADILQKKSSNKKTTSWFYVTLVMGLLLGSFPNNRLLDDTWYRFINWKFLPDPAHFYHTIGVFLIFLSVLHLSKIQSMLTNKALIFMGKISFAMFLTHYLIISSISTFLYMRFLNLFNPIIAFFIILLISFLLSTISAYMFFLLVDKNANQLSKTIGGKFLKNLR